MSWEDCGFKPGKINGPARCARQCGECDGEHHFYVSDNVDEVEEAADAAGEDVPDDFEPEMFFQCKHCGARAEMIPAY